MPKIGINFSVHRDPRYSVRDFVEFASKAQKYGMQRVWVNDNLTHRNTFVVLGAIAASVPIELGCAIAVPYHRNPIDLADSVGSITELSRRQFVVGIARGASHSFEQTKPLAMVRETAVCLRQLFDGEQVDFDGFPTLSSYFRMRPHSRARLGFQPRGPVLIYGGGWGHQTIAQAGACMDGLVLGSYVNSLVVTSRLRPLLDLAEAARPKSNGKGFSKSAQINISLSNDISAAKKSTTEVVIRAIGRMAKMGFSDREYGRLGIEARQVEELLEAVRAGGAERGAEFITDQMIDSTLIVGDARHCRDRIAEWIDAFTEYGFDEVSFAHIGPDYSEAIKMIGEEILPYLATRR